MARLKEMYNNEIVDAMTKKFGYQNIMQVPKLEKIVVNMGVGEAKENSKILDSAIADLERSQVRRPLQQRQRILSQTSRFVRECQSDVR